MKCLEKLRDRRYESAGALGRDVQRYLADVPVEARPPSAGYRLRKYVRRHQGQVIAASLIVVSLLAVAGTVVAGGMYARAERERVAEAEARQNANEQRKLAEHLESVAETSALEAAARALEAAASKEQVRQILYSADIQLARNHWDGNRADRMREVLQRHRPAAGERDYRGFEWHYLWRLANGSQRMLRGHTQPIDSLTFAGSVDVLLSGDVEYQYRIPGTLRKWNLKQTDEPQTLFTQAVSSEGVGYYPGIRRTERSEVPAISSLASAILTNADAPRPSVKTTLTPIEEFQVGDRVLGESSTGEDDTAFDSEIIPCLSLCPNAASTATLTCWRLIRVRRFPM